ncbi:MAG TPA: 6,7-dimethyl-8-ribityllumazine synthase [Candidatus Binataceae bacterium]
MKIAFVVSEFNSEVTGPMEETARRHAKSLGVEVSRTIHVPGVFDMPPIVKRLLKRADVDGVVMIGAVITGETHHDEVITHAIAHVSTMLAAEFEKPVGFSITGPGMTDAQAVGRIENATRGVDAVVRVARELEKLGKG